MKDIEQRGLKDLEIRATNVDGKKSIEGYAAVFDKLSERLGFFREKIAKGAFRNVLADGSNVVLIHNHNTDNLLSSTSSKTLELKEDDTGLHFRADLPNTARGDEVFELVNAGVLDGMSFGFTAKTDTWEVKQGEDIRTVEEVGSLLEISTTAFPAYTDTSIAKRSFDEHRKDDAPNSENEKFYETLNNLKKGE